MSTVQKEDTAPGLDELKSRIKELKDQKGGIARQFKSVEPGSPDHAELVAAMQRVSSELKDLESEQKEHLRLKRKKKTNKSENALPLPTQFLLPDSHYGQSITVRTLQTSGDWKQWWEFLDASGRDSLYHSRPIMNFLKKQPYTDCQVFAAWSDKGEMVGGLPIVRLSTPLFGQFTVSQPFFNYGGPVTRYWDVFEALLDECERNSSEQEDKYAEIRTTIKGKRKGSTKKVSMLRALPSSAPALDRELGAKVRAQVKKANEFNPRFVVGGKECLDDFYTVFSTNMRDLGTPVESKQFFVDLLDALSSNGKIAVVYVNKKPVGAGFLTQHKNMMEIPWASTVRSAHKMNINMWMYDNILKFAISERVKWFDFGRSTKNAGTYRFKKQWGAAPHQHYWYRLGSAADPESSLNPDNPKFKLAIAAWQRLPLWLSRKLGPYIARQLP